MRVVRPIVAYLRGLEKDVGPLLAGLGIDPPSLFEPETRIPIRLLFDLLRGGEELARDPDIGLHVAETIDFRIFAQVSFQSEYLVAQLFANSATLGEGLARFARYFPIAYPSSRLTLTREQGALRVRHQVLGALEIPRAFTDIVIGSTVRAARDLSVRPVTVLEIRFAHPEPVSRIEYHRILDAPLCFSAGEDAFLLREADLDVPLRTARPTIDGLERHAQEVLAQMPEVQTFPDQVRALILAELEAGDPGAAQVARGLSMSARTLARRLEEHGTSHQALLDEVRAELARRYLLEEGRPVGDVARRLGFSDNSAFHRAFRRWYGTSPTEYRRGKG
jgi:AraC-like DNA-binding protein